MLRPGFYYTRSCKPLVSKYRKPQRSFVDDKSSSEASNEPISETGTCNSYSQRDALASYLMEHSSLFHSFCVA
ncbi:Hypothetical predicted protein [Octopus vulgaris]|uniref:Uncharacterized protein n=1 Tax=Octopus vulgaris TaxID=6645 RepID=A0AA36AJD2_OCTVU|nr:Hypothetical predicted protein [Octopus vulgaris]